MEILTFSTLGLVLAAVREKLGDGLLGIAGSWSYDLCKSGARAMAERARAGELRPNHVLLRAVRRSQLRATLFTVGQYHASLLSQPDSSVRHLVAWCARLDSWLREEIEATARNDYRNSMPALSADEAAFLVRPAEAEDSRGQRNAFAAQVLSGLLRELEEWNQAENGFEPLQPDLPEAFVSMLADGWTEVECVEGILQRYVTEPLTRRRGAGAEMVRRRQQRLSEGIPQGGVAVHTWFECFASDFSEELSKEPGLQAVFTAKLLAELVLARREHGMPAGNPGQEFADLLRQQASDLTARLDAMASQYEELAQGVSAIRQSLQLPYRAPWMLPPRAMENSFQGRSNELAWLTQRLQRAEARTYVLGMAGFGKTALAAEALHLVVDEGGRIPANPFTDGVVYLDLYALKQTDATFLTLATALGDVDDGRSPPAARARRACAGRRILIVLEGAELADGTGDLPSLQALLAGLDTTHNKVLVLTRDSAQCQPVQTCRLDDPLSPEEAGALFDKLAVPAPAPDVRQQVLALLDGHPLAITWAASLLADPSEDPRDLYVEWQQASLPPISDPLESHHTLNWLLERSMRGLDEDSRTVLQLDLAMACVDVPATWYARDFAESDPLRRHAAREHATGLSQRGRLLQTQGRLGAALSTYAQALGILRGLLQMDSRNEQWLHDVCVSLQHVGAIHLKRGQTDLAWSAFEEMLKLARPMAEGNPSDSDVQRTLSVALHGSAQVHKLRGKPDDAASAYKEMLAIAREMASAHPREPGWQQALGVSLNNMGRLLEEQGRLSDALPAFEESLALARELMALDATNTIWISGVASALRNVGGVLRQQDQLAAAEQRLEEALRLKRRLFEASPDNLGWSVGLAEALMDMGLIREMQGRLEESLSTYEEALLFARGPATADDSNFEWQLNVAATLDGVARVHVARGHDTNALSAYEESVEVKRSLAAIQPPNLNWQRALSFTLTAVAEVLHRLGQADKACSCAREALAIDEHLTEIAPKRAGWQNDLPKSRVQVIWLCGC